MRFTRHTDPACLEDIRPAHHPQGDLHILFDQKDGEISFLMQAGEDLRQPINDDWS